MSLLEAQLLHSKHSLQLPLPFSDWLTRATESRRRAPGADQVVGPEHLTVVRDAFVVPF
jgi:hypothetical protein